VHWARNASHRGGVFYVAVRLQLAIASPSEQLPELGHESCLSVKIPALAWIRAPPQSDSPEGFPMVPHLVTALNGPLLELEKKILTATPAIERWFRLEWQEHTPPFYCSVDLRNSGFKLAPVDTNLFPGGFNNLAPEMLPLAVQAAMAAIDKYCPDLLSAERCPADADLSPDRTECATR
jgi:hypothetical protein